MATQTQERPQPAKELVPVDRLPPMRLPVTKDFLAKLDVTEFDWRNYCDTLFDGARTPEGIALAVMWSRAKNIPLIDKPCHIVSVYSSALKRYVERVWPSITYFRTIAHRTGEYMGTDKPPIVYGPTIEEEFVQPFSDERTGESREIKRTVKYPEWVEMTVYRKVQGEKCGFTSRVVWKETYATAGRGTEMPNEMWLKRPFGQVEKCVEAAVLRRAFTEHLGSDYVVEEMEGKVVGEEIVLDRGAMRPSAPVPPPRPSSQGAKAPDKPSETVTNPDEKSDVIDVETFDFNAYQDRLLEAPDEASVQEVWEHSKADELLSGSSRMMTQALTAKTKRLRQIRDQQPGG